MSQVLSGTPPDLLADTPYTQNPWPGYSITAGLNYTLTDEIIPPENVPVLTGIVPVGGIPSLDETLRPLDYENEDSPEAANIRAMNDLGARGIDSYYWDGSFADHITGPVDVAENGPQAENSGTGVLPPDNTTPPPTPQTDMGIQPTPIPGGSG